MWRKFSSSSRTRCPNRDDVEAQHHNTSAERPQRSPQERKARIKELKDLAEKYASNESRLVWGTVACVGIEAVTWITSAGTALKNVAPYASAANNLTAAVICGITAATVGGAFLYNRYHSSYTRELQQEERHLEIDEALEERLQKFANENAVATLERKLAEESTRVDTLEHKLAKESTRVDTLEQQLKKLVDAQNTGRNVSIQSPQAGGPQKGKEEGEAKGLQEPTPESTQLALNKVLSTTQVAHMLKYDEKTPTEAIVIDFSLLMANDWKNLVRKIVTTASSHQLSPAGRAILRGMKAYDRIEEAQDAATKNLPQAPEAHHAESRVLQQTPPGSPGQTPGRPPGQTPGQTR
jgi:hypothetical protein